MATKRTQTKKEEPKSDFDWKQALDKLEIPLMLKAGFGYYIESKNIAIKSENDLQKELTKFKELNAGV